MFNFHFMQWYSHSNPWLDLDILPSSICILCIPSSVFSGWLIGRKEDSIRNYLYLYLPGLLCLKNVVYFCSVNVPRIKNQVFQYFLFYFMNLRFVSKYCNIYIMCLSNKIEKQIKQCIFSWYTIMISSR